MLFHGRLLLSQWQHPKEQLSRIILWEGQFHPGIQPSDFISDLDFISVEWIGYILYILFRQTIKIGFLHNFLRITKTNRDSFKPPRQVPGMRVFVILLF